MGIYDLRQNYELVVYLFVISHILHYKCKFQTYAGEIIYTKYYCVARNQKFLNFNCVAIAICPLAMCTLLYFHSV